MHRKSNISRRQFMKAAVATAALGAFGKSLLAAVADFQLKRGGPVQWGRLKFRIDGPNQLWNVYPHADLSLIQRIRAVTSIDLEPKFNAADVGILEEMIKYPFIFMHDQRVPILTDQNRSNIREYQRRGGFLFIDDCVLSAAEPDLFYVNMRKEMSRILPGARYVNLDMDKGHEVFRCAYRLPNGLPHIQGRNHGLVGVYDKDRLVALMCAVDLHCAWARQLDPQKEELALQMGVNLYVYAMTH